MLIARDLHKRYGQVAALDGCSLTAAPGRLVGFLGPNGAGKTTAMRAMFGLVALDKGEVSWHGRPIGPAERRRFGYMPEQRGLYPKMRLQDQLAYFARLHGSDATDAVAAARRWLTELGLADRADDPVEKLSHGNQQRIQLAAALVHQPELLVLDEPFSGLDPLGVEAMEGVLRREAERGVAVVFSSHQLDLVESLCDDVVIINRGRDVVSGTLHGLRSASDRRHVEVAFDEPTHWEPTAVFPGATVLEHRDEGARLLVPAAARPEDVLAAVRRVGPLRSFSFEPPRLSELFVEAVTR